MSLSKESLLQSHPNLTITRLKERVWQFRIEQFTIEGTEHAARLANIFKTERTFFEGLEDYSTQFGANQDWSTITQAVIELVENGLLLNKSEKPAVASHAGRFDSAPIHIRMLNDEARTKAYQQAIRNQVTPDDIVLDIGTGTGVLAVTAAMAGAKHVYAVEQTSLGDIAQQVFEKNGLAHKITLIKGNSKTIVLPEKATVLVSELIGNDPLAEGILSTTEDALKRLMQPDPRLIPKTLNTYAIPFEIPQQELAKYKFLPSMIERWRQQYAIDFSPFMFNTEQSEQICTVNTFNTRAWKRLGEPVLLNNIDLSSIPYSNINVDQQFDILVDGHLNGILIYFDIMLGDEMLFSIHPDKAISTNHWMSHVWLPGQPLEVENGHAVRFCYDFLNGCSTFALFYLNENIF
jgi:predicted RNA methylase